MWEDGCLRLDTVSGAGREVLINEWAGQRWAGDLAPASMHANG